MTRRIALAITILMPLIAAVDYLVLKVLGIWGVIDSPLKALLLGMMLLFNILAMPVGIMLLILRLPTRRNRGLCPKCAYDLRYEFHRGCPECGWGREESDKI